VRWQLQEAKQRFSELVQRVLDEGPQMVTRRGREVVVVVSAKEFRRLSGSIPDFRDYLLSGPDFDELDIKRSKEPARVIDL
jgi:prevent-host-death family protein